MGSASTQVPPVAQRLIRYADRTPLNPKKFKRQWNGLTPGQRTHANRLMYDFYRVYTPDSVAHLFAFLRNPASKALKITEYYRKQEDPLQAGDGKYDPHFDHFHPDASGGFAVKEEQEQGRAPQHVFLPIGPHRSNWANFVELHYAAVVARLSDPKGKGLSAADSKTLSDLRAEGLRFADEMDQQEVKTSNRMTESSPGRVRGSIAIEEAVNKMWDLVAVGKTHRETLATAELPRWGQLRGGMGTSVEFTMSNNAMRSAPAGSRTDVKQFSPPWLEVLRARVTPPGIRSMYVEGHLLNANVGGPAAPYNIIPLSANANAVHEKEVEHVLKTTVLAMLNQQALTTKHNRSPSRNPILKIVYKVTVDYTPHPKREATEQWQEAAKLLREIVQAMPKWPNKHKPATRTVQQFHDDLDSGGDYERAKLKVGGRALDLSPGGVWDVLQPALEVVAWDRSATTMTKALALTEGVRDVWKAEEKLVPSGLFCDLETHRMRGLEKSGSLKKHVKNDIDHIQFGAATR